MRLNAMPIVPLKDVNLDFMILFSALGSGLFIGQMLSESVIDPEMGRII